MSAVKDVAYSKFCTQFCSWQHN